MSQYTLAPDAARARWVSERFQQSDLARLKAALVEFGATPTGANKACVAIAWHAMVLAAPSPERTASKVNRAMLRKLISGLKAVSDARKALDPEVSVRFSLALESDPGARSAWSRIAVDADTVEKQLEKFANQYRGAKPTADEAIGFLVIAVSEWHKATGRWPAQARAVTPASRPPKAPLYDLLDKLLAHASDENGRSKAQRAWLTPNRFIEAIKAAKKSAAK